MTWLGIVNRYIYAQGNALVRKFYMCTETVRISLFKSYCSSLYTSSRRSNYRSESLRKLQNGMSRFLYEVGFFLFCARAICNAPTLMQISQLNVIKNKNITIETIGTESCFATLFPSLPMAASAGQYHCDDPHINSDLYPTY